MKAIENTPPDLFGQLSLEVERQLGGVPSLHRTPEAQRDQSIRTSGFLTNPKNVDEK